jgi:hypothetical protein
LNGEPWVEFNHGDCVTYEKNGKPMKLPIKTVGRLRLFVPELERMVFITLKTTSYYDRLNIDANLSAIQFLANTLNGGNAAGIPFYVYRREQEICWNKEDGSAQRIKKWLVNIEADSEWVKAATSRMANFALTGEVMTRALLPSPITITSTARPDDDDEDAPEPEEMQAGEVTDIEEPAAPPAKNSDVGQNWGPDWEAAKAAKADEKKEEVAKPVTRPYPPELFKSKFTAAVALVEKQNHLDKIGEREQRIVAGAIDGVFNGEKTMRYELCKWLTGKASTKEMSKAQLKALMLVMGINDFNQAPIADAMTELKQAHEAALVVAGQQDLFSGGVTLEAS